MSPGKTEPVHLAVGQSLGCGSMPFLIPGQSGFALLNTFLEAIAHGKAQLCLAFIQPGDIMAFGTVVLECQLYRVHSQFSSHPAKDHSQTVTRGVEFAASG